MNTSLLQNETLAGWIITAALHSLAAGLLFLGVLLLVRRHGPTEIRAFGRAGTVALLLLPVTLLTVGHLNRKAPPLALPVPENIVTPTSTTRTEIIIPIQATSAPAVAPAPAFPTTLLINALGIAWLLGSALLLIRTAVGMARMQRLRRQLRAPDRLADPALCALLERLGIARSTIRVADTEIVPFATGLLAPVIVVPANLCILLKPHEARMILRHEQAHLRNHDLGWAAVQGVARALHWWNPCARALLRQTELASEGLCDHAALTGEKGRNGKAYARCLVDLAERVTRRRLPACALSVTGDFRRLRRRLLWIADYRPTAGGNTRAALQCVALALLAATVLGLTALNAGAELPAKKEPLATTRQGTNREAVTRFGPLEIHAERTVHDGKAGQIRFEDAKVITPHYEARARTAEFTWDPEHPLDLEKATLHLGGGVSARIGEKLALSETADLSPQDASITFRGYPRVLSEVSEEIATAPETTAGFFFPEPGVPKDFVGSRITLSTKWTGPNRVAINLEGLAEDRTVPRLRKPTAPAEEKPAPEDPAAPTEDDTVPRPEKPAAPAAAMPGPEEGLRINAETTSYEDGVAIAKGKVRIQLTEGPHSLDVTADEAAYFATGQEILLRGNVIVKLRGHSVGGRRAMVDLNAMTARVQGPGSFFNGEQNVRMDETLEVTINEKGLGVSPAGPAPTDKDDPAGKEPDAGTSAREMREVYREAFPANPQMRPLRRIPTGDIYHEGWDKWREKRFNRSLYPSASDEISDLPREFPTPP